MIFQSKVLHFLDRLIQALSNTLGALAALCLATLFLLMMAEIILRGFFHYSLGFTWEINGYLMGSVIFLGLGSALKSRSHIRIRLLLEMLPPRFTRWLDMVATVGGILITLYLLRAMTLLAWTSYIRNSVSSTPEQIPLVLPQAALCFGLLVFLFQLLAALARLICTPSTTTKL
ncbi:TRAP transporter small permease [Paenalcaligenes niemegkensis]|uniref:TRAP transporter small permease subunit n=1 Tax=Paenalcaligenes niemegkensis TaxID=2895469 RepID=UPI001EE78990|nr:TRAP transporter small permease [Paenalcaligenes niemegkensis]MCQ9618048.1 TRAP transporter small permease [Paenalcaligenes niemegkensis]